MSRILNKRCPLCSNENTNQRFSLNDYSVYYCCDCKLEFNSNFPPNKTIESTFSKDYFSDIQREAFDMAIMDYRLDGSYNLYKNGLELAEKFVKGRKLLDIGAGMGVLMKIASDSGWQVEGVEISSYSTKFIKETYGFNISNQDLLYCDYPDSSFDLITFWDAIEHLEQPKEKLNKAYNLLKSEGLLLITTDNYNSLLAKISKLLYFTSFGLFDYPLKRTYIPYNKTYFNDVNFRNLLQKIGFKTLFFKKIQYPIKKLRLNSFEKFVVKLAYGMENLSNLQSQFLIIARK